MPATAWRRAMQHRVTVRRNTTAVSASGATRFTYVDVKSRVRCSLQEGGGRLEQLDLGQNPGRVKHALFGIELSTFLQQNDLLVLENVNVGQIYRITHVHVVPDRNGPHVECQVEEWVPEGGN